MGNKIDQLTEEANNLFEKGDLIEARIKYQKLNRIQPCANFENSLGLIAFYRERYQSAVKHLLRAIEQEPKNLDYKVNLAMTYSSWDKNKEAIATLSIMFTLVPLGSPPAQKPVVLFEKDANSFLD